MQFLLIPNSKEFLPAERRFPIDKILENTSVHTSRLEPGDQLVFMSDGIFRLLPQSLKVRPYENEESSSILQVSLDHRTEEPMPLSLVDKCIENRDREIEALESSGEHWKIGDDYIIGSASTPTPDQRRDILKESKKTVLKSATTNMFAVPSASKPSNKSSDDEREKLLKDGETKPKRGLFCC